MKGRAEALDAAADWVLKLNAPEAGEAEWLAFEGWLAADPHNRAAYDAAASLWEELDQQAAGLMAHLDAEVVAPLVRTTPRRRPISSGAGIWALAGVGVAATAALVVVVRPHPVQAPATVAEQVYTTAKGERRHVVLPDGTAMDLNSGSRIAVRFDGAARRVRIDDAEVAFDVTHDPARPFLITAGDRTVRVVGTEFDVLRHDGKLSVAVRRGVVEVAPSAQAKGETLRLTPGRRLKHSEGAADSLVETVAADEAFGWKSGQLIYRDQPLEDVVSDLNRYFDAPLRIADARTARLRFSGVLMVDREDAVVDRLNALLPVTAVRSDQGITFSSRGTTR